LLIADKVSKHYDTPRGPIRIVDNVSLALGSGEAVAIMGPSGCGKSTLLYILGALEPPSAGTVQIDDTNPYELSEPEQAAFRGAHIGFVFQDHLLLPQLSALENVLVPTLVAATGPSPVQMRQRARALLVEVGLESRLDHRPGELSGGERQRVALARALVRQPALVLCDEPTGNLDSASADSVADLLVTLHRAQETMLVVVTHNSALAARFGRRYEISGGQLHPVT
jgi:lipoprotein-releasing system ATP-binding protein